MEMCFSWSRSLFLLLSLLLTQQINAQKQIDGIVHDPSHDPLAYANVLLLNATDSTFLKGGITDDFGKFLIENVEPGEYIVKISMIGFSDVISPKFQIKDQDGTYHVPLIGLKENSEQLNEVEVVAQRALFEQKIDRMVVNVDNSITSAGSTALEVLQRSPGIMVNPQSNSISMSGKDGVIVMMNDKISRMPMDALIEMLRGMSSDNIERIELIHTPPANFDAEGNAGFINIVLKKNQNNGFNGGFTVNAGYGKKEKSGAAVNFNYRKNQFNLFGDYSWNYNNNPQTFKNYRGFFDQQGDFIENSGVSDRDPTRTHVQNARLGLDVQLTDKTIIGGLVTFGDRNWDMNALNNIEQKKNGALTSRILIPNVEDNRSYNLVGNINLQHNFNANEKLNVDFDYAYFNNDNPSSYVNEFYDSEDNLVNTTELRVSKKTPMNIMVGKIDYSKNFGDDVKLELGLKGTSTTFDNDILVEDLIQGEWVRAPLFSSLAMMTEDIGAAYSALSFKLNSNTDVKTGLRYEYTNSNLGTEEAPNLVDRQYHRLFPSLFVSNKINENNSIQFSYSRRINRPSFRQLAPFFIFFDPNTVGTGNPALQPSTTDAVRTTYIFKTIQWGVQYSYTDEIIGRFQPTVDIETNTQVDGAKNFDDAHQVSTTLSFPITFTKWWEMRTSWTAQWQQINDVVNGEKLSFENYTWMMNGSMSFKLPNKFNMELSGVYFAPQLYGTVKWQDFHQLNFGVSKDLNNNLGTVRFSVNDIFQGGNWRGELDDPNLDFKYSSLFGFTERVFRVTYSKRFGNNKIKGARNRQTGSADEQRRTN